MLFALRRTLYRKELNYMKRLLRVFSALFAALLLGWYCMPQVYRMLHLPDTVVGQAELSAPALSAHVQTARFVRESGDDRLFDATDRETRILLFGAIPLKTVTNAVHLRTVNAGGKAVGVVLRTEGVQIVGLEKIETDHGPVCPAALSGLSEGDMICELDGKPVTDSESFAKMCAVAGETCRLTFLRNGERLIVTVTLATDEHGVKRLGAWVRDSTSGIGTLSFYDRTTGAYAALGHGVTDVDTQKLISPAKGYLTEATIMKIRKSNGDTAGELIGQFSTNRADAVATVDKNTVFGISGKLTTFFDPDERAVEIAPSGAAHRGDATILSTVDGNVSEFAVKVIRVDVQSSPGTQGMMIEIVDPALLEKAGGIVQGMSGSPLMQDGRLIGVVTHVFLSRPTRGYCIYAEWMVKELMP